jgi:hypothetical protein
MAPTAFSGASRGRNELRPTLLKQRQRASDDEVSGSKNVSLPGCHLDAARFPANQFDRCDKPDWEVTRKKLQPRARFYRE